MTLKFLGNVIEGHPVLYLNVSFDTMKSLAESQLKDNLPVWFGCDVGKMIDSSTGILDTRVFDYPSVMKTNFDLPKGDRIEFGESRLTHSMLLLGFHRVNDRITRWKVENSWGSKNTQDKPIGKNGFFVMSDSWFSDYTYQIVVDKKYLSKEHRSILASKPVELEPWDPLGALALMH